jgi:hypothetical protein
MDLDTPDCDTAFSATFTGPPPSSTPQRLNGTFSTASRPAPAAAAANTTFDKLSPAENDIRLNATFNKLECSEIVSSPVVGGGGRLLPAGGGSGAGGALLNATFDASRGGGGDDSGTRMRTPPAGLNATFNRSNSSGGPAGGGFGGRGSGSGGGVNQRKMSEDRLSSASSG